MSNAGGVCTTAAETPVKEVYIPGFSLYTGVRVTVLFKYACSANSLSLNVNETGAKGIRWTRGDSIYHLILHFAYWRNSSSAYYEVWQANTILTFIYDGTYWILEGNPVLESYYSTTKSYVVYADGKIEQWGHSTTSTSYTTVLTYLVPFATAESYSISGNDVQDKEMSANVQMYNKTSSSCTVYRTKVASTSWDWRAVGY